MTTQTPTKTNAQTAAPTAQTAPIDEYFDIDNPIVLKILDKFPSLIQVEYLPYEEYPPFTMQQRLDYLAVKHPDKLKPISCNEQAWKALLLICSIQRIPTPIKPVLAPTEPGIWQISDCKQLLKRKLTEHDSGDVRPISEWRSVMKLPDNLERYLATIDS